MAGPISNERTVFSNTNTATGEPAAQFAAGHAFAHVDENWEALVQHVMNEKGVSREVAEAEVDALY